MANDTCPHCGAERRYMERYDCGTWLAGVVGNNEVRAGICWDRQLAAVVAERDELRRELAEIREKMQDAAMEAREEQCST